MPRCRGMSRIGPTPDLNRLLIQRAHRSQNSRFPGFQFPVGYVRCHHVLLPEPSETGHGCASPPLSGPLSGVFPARASRCPRRPRPPHPAPTAAARTNLGHHEDTTRWAHSKRQNQMRQFWCRLIGEVQIWLSRREKTKRTTEIFLMFFVLFV